MDDVFGKVSRDGEIEDEDGEIEDEEDEDKSPSGSVGCGRLPKGKGSNSRILCNTFSLTLVPESVDTWDSYATFILLVKARFRSCCLVEFIVVFAE